MKGDTAMDRVQPKWAYRGSIVRTACSSHVIVTQVLYSFKALDQIFHGVKVVPEPGHPSYYDGLLWVVDDGEGLLVWQECRQRPRIIDGKFEHEIEEIVGHYESWTGSVYYAIKWMDYKCPTWESEEDMLTCHLINKYWLCP